MPYTPYLDLQEIPNGLLTWDSVMTSDLNILDTVIGKIKFTDGEPGVLTAGMVVYISGNNTVSRADATSNTKPGIAICRTTDGVTVKIKQFGVAIDVLTIGAGDIVAGDRVFLSTTLGKVVKTPPQVSGNIVQLIGRASKGEVAGKVDVLLAIDFNPLEV